MTEYFCPKCEEVTSATKDSGVIYDKPCRVCSEITIPLQNINKLSVKEIIKTSGDIWIFHKFDKDPFPSTPHGHNKETRERLDIYTGYIYDHNKNIVRKLNKKYLFYIQNRLKEKKFI